MAAAVGGAESAGLEWKGGRGDCGCGAEEMRRRIRVGGAAESGLESGGSRWYGWKCYDGSMVFLRHRSGRSNPRGAFRPRRAAEGRVRDGLRTWWRAAEAEVRGKEVG